MMDPRITETTVVHLLYRDGVITKKTGMNVPSLWVGDGGPEDIILYQIEPTRKVDYWDRLIEHIETFDMVMPHPGSDEINDYIDGWSETRLTIYGQIRMQFLKAWIDAFIQVEKGR